MTVKMATSIVAPMPEKVEEATEGLGSQGYGLARSEYIENRIYRLESLNDYVILL